MMIYMVHPQHGAMHVYDEAQAVANEKNGWVRAQEPSVKVAETSSPEPKPSRKSFFMPSDNSGEV